MIEAAPLAERNRISSTNRLSRREIGQVWRDVLDRQNLVEIVDHGGARPGCLVEVTVLVDAPAGSCWPMGCCEGAGAFIDLPNLCP